MRGTCLPSLLMLGQCGSLRCTTVSTVSVQKSAMTRRRASEATIFSLQNEERRVQSNRLSGCLASIWNVEGMSERNPASKIDRYRLRSSFDVRKMLGCVTISDSLYAETHQCFLAKSILELKTREKQENCRDFKSTSQEVHK